MTKSKGWDWQSALEAMPGRWTEVAEELFAFTALLEKERVKTVYDLGCGVGRHTVFLAQRGFDLTASDISPSGIRKTREWLASLDLEATVLELDMLNWPFEDGAFDAIIAYNVVYHAGRDQVDQVLAQAYRTLRPNGLMFVTFKSTVDSEFGQGEELAPFTYAPLAGVEQGIPHYYVDEKELRRLLGPFQLQRVVHKAELPVFAGRDRKRAHWVTWVRKSS